MIGTQEEVSMATIDALSFEVAEASSDDEGPFVAVMMSFDSSELSYVDLLYKLKTRESVEEAIDALRTAADTIWPTS